eukprot:3409202-Prymnesium_polylepis.2
MREISQRLPEGALHNTNTFRTRYCCEDEAATRTRGMLRIPDTPPHALAAHSQRAHAVVYAIVAHRRVCTDGLADVREVDAVLRKHMSSIKVLYARYAALAD